MIPRLALTFILLSGCAQVLGTNNRGYGGFQLYHEAGIRTSASKPVADLASYHQGLWKSSDQVVPWTGRPGAVPSSPPAPLTSA